MSYTIVTVAHEVDYAALCFQARSFAKYLPWSLVNRIILIENPTIPNQNRLLEQYGVLRDLVMIVKGSNLAPPEAFRWSGWWSQQILKLMVAPIVNNDRYICLDAKNVLVFPLEQDFLELDGRPRSFHVNFTKHSSMRWLRNSLNYFGLPESVAKAFVPTTTPFVLVTDLVLDLIQFVETREKTSLSAAFLKHQLTEFFLYGSYLTATNQLDYDFTGQECRTVWELLYSDAYVHESILATELYQLPFFSVHRRAVPKLSAKAKDEIDEFWKRREL